MGLDLMVSDETYHAKFKEDLTDKVARKKIRILAVGYGEYEMVLYWTSRGSTTSSETALAVVLEGRHLCVIALFFSLDTLSLWPHEDYSKYT